MTACPEKPGTPGDAGIPPSETEAPELITEPEDALPQMRMEDLPPKLQAAAAAAGWNALMPVQARTLPYFLKRRDLMVQSRTGSGKTGAFMLPILERIDPARAQCQALILVPTRELARQVGEEAVKLGAGQGVRTIAVYGGVAYGPQIEAFEAGAHIVVGTPGRILDHLLKRSLSLEGLEVLVFDEADRMLSMGFYPDMRQVQRYLPRRRISAYMFSATFPQNVISLAGQFLHQPEMLSLSKDHIHVAETEHVYYLIPGIDKDRVLVRIIEMENPTSSIIFCNTKAQVHYVTVVLQRFGYDADELSADLPQKARDRVLDRVRQGTLRFLVATDVAARGIDIPEISHIFQYETPDDPESYIHRAGRTGRAGASGVAISLVSAMEHIELRRIGKRFSIEFEQRPVPTDEDVEVLVSERLTALLEAQLRGRDRLQAERARRFIPLAQSLAQNDDESEIIAMLLDDHYQKTLHAPAMSVSEPEAPPAQTLAESRPPRDAGRPRGGGSGFGGGSGGRRRR